MNNLDEFYTLSSPYGLNKKEKNMLLQPRLKFLDDFHYAQCESYQRIVDSISSESNEVLLPVRLFKDYALKSVSDESIVKTLTSSGTTSQKVSRIYLDRDTSTAQTKVLVKIMQQFLGKKRLPMLIVDHPNVVKDRLSFSARGAGILGLSTFGRNHTYALDDDMNINFDAIVTFMEKNKGQKIFLFGFTFMVWKYFLQALKSSDRKIDLQDAVLIHSGGWKKLQDIAVDNATFKSAAKELAGITNVHNFYGMVEQVGSIFVECSEGYLHTPVYSDIEMLNMQNMEPVPFGEDGVIAVHSALPSSYPGHRLLTEDVGTIVGEDDCKCGFKGKYFLVHGRVAKAEVRGCSDTHASEASK